MIYICGEPSGLGSGRGHSSALGWTDERSGRCQGLRQLSWPAEALVGREWRCLLGRCIPLRETVPKGDWGPPDPEATPAANGIAADLSNYFFPSWACIQILLDCQGTLSPLLSFKFECTRQPWIVIPPPRHVLAPRPVPTAARRPASDAPPALDVPGTPAGRVRHGCAPRLPPAPAADAWVTLSIPSASLLTARFAAHYQQSLPSLSQMLNQPSHAYVAQQQQQQQLLEQQQQFAYAQQHQGYSLPVAAHVQQQHPALAYAQYPPLPASPPPQALPVRYASPAPQQPYYASPSPPASPTAGTPTAARPFACDHCKAGFSRPHDLKRHRASVHFRNDAEGPTCTRCGRPFSRPDALRRHAQRGCHVGEDADS